MLAEGAQDVHGEALNEPGSARRKRPGCRGSRRRWRGSLARCLQRESAPARAAAPPRRYPAPRRSTHPHRHAPWVGHTGPAGRAVVSRQVRRSPGERSQSSGRNAAHCTGRPLHPQGHPKILSNRSAKTAPQKASSGPTLVRGATAGPGGPDGEGQARSQAQSARGEPPQPAEATARNGIRDAMTRAWGHLRDHRATRPPSSRD
jgi:hypothetical protein